MSKLRQSKRDGAFGTRSQRIKQFLNYWQDLLELTDWELSFKFVTFRRKDGYNQSGDIKVDQKRKKATILLKKQETRKDSVIILHELIHLLLWQFDTHAEQHMPASQKNLYFSNLEKVVARLEKIFLAIGVDKT